MLQNILLRNGSRIVTLLIALLWAAPNLSYAQQELNFSEQMLATPRRTVHTFLHWQLEGHLRKDFVAKTMQEAEELSTNERFELASQLHAVLDARGLIIDYQQIPNRPNYVDSLSGLNQYILFRSLPEIYLIRKDSVWIFSKASISAIPELYQNEFSMLSQLLIDKLPEGFDARWLGIRLWQYLAVFVLLLSGLVLKKLFEFAVQNSIRRITERTSSVWDDRLVQSLEKPAGLSFLILFFMVTYQNLQLPVMVNYYLNGFLEIAFSASLIWILYRLTDVVSDYLQEFTLRTESKLDDQLVPLLRKSLKIFIVILGFIFILQNNGINVASLLAGLGLGGLAFALAAKDTLANFFGSITIFLDKPFQVGDWIKTAEAEGTVEEVGFRSTRIRTFYNSLVSIPNAKMADAEIDNLGLRQYRRIKTVLNLTYSTTPEQMEAFVEGIKAIITANDFMRRDFYEVHFNGYGAHSLDVLVYCFLEVPSWSDELQQKHNFFLEILRLAKEVGVEFAFPTQTLHVDSFYQGEPRKVGTEREPDELARAVKAFGPNGEKARPEGITLQAEGEPVDYGSHAKHRGS